MAVPRGASASEALYEALVGRALDNVALVLEPGGTYDGSIVVDRESRPFGAPPPSVSISVGGGAGAAAATGATGATAPTTTLRVDTKQPYVRVLEARGDGVSLRVEGVRLAHASKSVASNYAALASAGAALELAACEVASSTGAGVAADGAASVLLTRCALVGNARQGLAAFGGSRDTSVSVGGGPALVRLDGCRVAGNGGDGVLVRDGAAVVLSGECVIEGNNAGAGLRWFVLEEREAEAALAVADAAAAAARGGQGAFALPLPLVGAGCRFARNAKGDIVVDTGGGAGDDKAAEALAAALRAGLGAQARSSTAVVAVV